MKYLVCLCLITLLAQASNAQLSYREYRSIRSIAEGILRTYPPSEYIYVGLGASPTGVMAYLEITQGSRQALQVPLSGTLRLHRIYHHNEPRTEQIDAILQRHFDLFLPESRVGSKRILLIDAALSGFMLTFAGERIQQSLHRRGLNNPVEMLAMVRDSEVEHLLRARSVDIYRLTRFAYGLMISQNFDEYRKYEPFRPDQIRSLQEYQPPQVRAPMQSFTEYRESVRQGHFSPKSYPHLLREIEQHLERDRLSLSAYRGLRPRPQGPVRCTQVFVH